MVKITNDCCSCAVPGYPCLGDSCELRHVKHYYCDKCGDEYDEVFHYESEELCLDCIKESLEIVE